MSPADINPLEPEDQTDPTGRHVLDWTGRFEAEHRKPLGQHVKVETVEERVAQLIEDVDGLAPEDVPLVLVVDACREFSDPGFRNACMRRGITVEQKARLGRF